MPRGDCEGIRCTGRTILPAVKIAVCGHPLQSAKLKTGAHVDTTPLKPERKAQLEIFAAKRLARGVTNR
jgi:hypothetical protein